MCAGSNPAARTIVSVSMPLSARPYFHSTFQELNDLFLSNQDSVAMLAALVGELENRDRAAAIALRSKIQLRLNKLSGGSSTARDNSYASTATPEENLTHSSDNDPNSRGRTAESAEDRNARPHSNSWEDSRLRRPTRLKRIEPLGVTGRPQKYVRPLKTDIALHITNDMPRATRYAVALGALIAGAIAQSW